MAREGRRLCGWHDTPLSPVGVRQAACLAEHLRTEAVEAVYASTLTRARETARKLARVWRVETFYLSDLCEISCGQVDGLPLGIVQNTFSELWQRNLAHTDDEFRWPGGESYREFRTRVVAAVERIAVAHSGQRVAVVTHAGVVSQIMGALTGTSPARWDLWRPGNCSVTEIRWRIHHGHVVRFDWRPAAGRALVAGQLAESR